MPTCEQVQRVYQLADTLDKVAREWPEHFTMEVWALASEHYQAHIWALSSDDVRVVRHLRGEHPAVCGTVGCSLGWAPYATGIPFPSDGGPSRRAWRLYAYKVLGIGTVDFSCLFEGWPEGSEYDASVQAGRLREWADGHVHVCHDPQENGDG